MITLANNTSIPQLGVGTWTLMGEVAIQNVCLALQAGFRLIDTYGSGLIVAARRIHTLFSAYFAENMMVFLRKTCKLR